MKKIVWAVDVLGEPEPRARAAAFLKALADPLGAAIERVYLLNPVREAVAFTALPRWAELLQAQARQKLDELGGGTLLVEPGPSIRRATRRVIEHATGSGADAILVSTHARTGLGRFFLGSFAETLLLQSTVPVITVNPSCQPPERIARIVYPTDFSQPSRRGFEKTVELAGQLGAKLTLYYKEPMLMIPSSLGEPASFFERSERQLLEIESLARAWVDWAFRRDCAVDSELDGKPGDVATAIAAYAERVGADLIAMAAQSGPVSALMLGSVTRKVIRAACCPVWVRPA